METIAIGVLALVGLAQIYFLVRLRQAAADLARVQERVGRLDTAVHVLADTCESGFSAVADQIGRTLEAVSLATAAAVPAPKRSANRRVRAAARNGGSVADIAAAEQMSEGEVRLRLQLPLKNGKVDSKPERRGRRALRAS